VIGPLFCHAEAGLPIFDSPGRGLVPLTLYIPATLTEMTGLALGCLGISVIDIDEANGIFGVDCAFLDNLERNSLIRYFGSSYDVFVEN
jgi:hypothetical protein